MSLPNQIQVSGITNPTAANGIYTNTNSVFTSDSDPNYSICFINDVWVITHSENGVLFLGDSADPDVVPSTFSVSGIGVTGTATVTEYTENTGVTEMADFNYHPDTYASTICFKINAPGIEKTWNMTSLALESTISTAAQGFTDVNWDDVKAGYAITIPQTLPRGSYDILFFLAAKSAVITTDVPETGFSFKWSGKALLAPVQRLTDFVA